MIPTPATLRDKMCLISCRIGLWRGFKTDNKIAAAGVNVMAQASGMPIDARMARSSYRLVDELRVKEMERHASATKLIWRHYTVPWYDEGERGAKVSGLIVLKQELSRRQDEWENALVPAFVRDYPAMIQDARSSLGPLFNPNLYPSPAKIETHFPFKIAIRDVPDLADWRLEGVDLDDWRQQTEQALRETIEAAQRNAWVRLYEPIAALAQTLREYTPGQGHQGTFHHTLVGNVAKIIDVLPAINIADDAVLTSFGELARQMLTTYDAKELREDTTAREQVADAADLLIEQMAQFL